MHLISVIGAVFNSLVDPAASYPRSPAAPDWDRLWWELAVNYQKLSTSSIINWKTKT